MYQLSQPPQTSASVDLTALAQNVAHVRRLAPRADVLAVVKANAYGHGAIEITRALQHLAVRRFGVATVDEGVALRQAGIRVELDDSNETVGNKIRKAVGEKVPYMLVIGDKEAGSPQLSVRDRGAKETREIAKEDFISEVREKIANYR